MALLEKEKKKVRLHPEVHRALAQLIESRDESYNDIVKRLIDHYVNCPNHS